MTPGIAHDTDPQHCFSAIVIPPLPILEVEKKKVVEEAVEEAVVKKEKEMLAERERHSTRVGVR